MVRMDVQMVSLPKKVAVTLLPDLRDRAKINAAVARINEMIARDEATLEGWPEVLTRNGNRAVSEDIDEVRYPTDFEPRKTAETDGKSAAKPAAGVHLMPVAFETRNVGTIFEVEPTFGRMGSIIGVNFVCQHVRLLRWQKVIVKNEPGPTVEIEQPVFHAMKTTTMVELRSGERCLVGVFEVPESDKQELFILRAEVVRNPVTIRPSVK